MHLPIVWVSPPHITTNHCSRQDQDLPDPDRQEDNPVAPQNELIKPQGKEQTEHQQAPIHNELAVQIKQKENHAWK